MRMSRTWIAAGLVMGIAGCSNDSELGSVYIKTGTISAALGGAISVTQTDCITDAKKCAYVGTSIVIPRGALAKDERITLSPGEDASSRDGKLIGPAIDFGPDGLSFSSPVEITLPVGKEIEKDLLRVYVTEADGTRSVIMPHQLAYDRQAGQVRFLASHFTTFQCGEANDVCSDVNSCPDGNCSNGRCNTDCDPNACGPAPGTPSWACADGSPGGFTGRCVRQADGSCGWEINFCPEVCSNTECGPAPGAPNIQCPDGTIAGPVCRRDENGTCRWENNQCPDVCENGQPCPPGNVCGPNGCVPAACDANNVSCPPGTTCDPATGNCTPLACTDPNGQPCPPGSTCDPATGVCNSTCICADGQPCAIGPDGAVHCGCNDLSDPNCNPNTCSNGQACPPGSVCDVATGMCVDECVCPDGQLCVPADANTGFTCQNDECDANECGPTPGIPNWSCGNGTVGGPTGRCLRNADGTCGWEIIWCPAECDPNVCGAPPPTDPNQVCPDGTIPPYVCSRNANGACAWQQSCGSN